LQAVPLLGVIRVNTPPRPIAAAMLRFAVLLLGRSTMGQVPVHGETMPKAFPTEKAGAWSVLLDEDENPALVAGISSGAAAWGSFEDAINETGWAILHIQTSAALSGRLQSYAAGFLEGSLTHERIDQQRKNMWSIDFPGMHIPVAVQDFLQANMKWMQQNAQAHPSEPYWTLAVFLLDQVQGLTDGFNAARRSFGETSLSLLQVYMMSLIDADMDDIVAALQAQGHAFSEPSPRLGSRPAVRRHRGHCSALIQCAPGNTDLYVGHATWDSYRSMIRLVKHLDMPLPGSLSRRMVFTCGPGSLYSADDFYVLDTGLAVLETSLSVHNTTLWWSVKPESMLTWARAMVANRLAHTGDEWTDLATRHSSGTYNNQWMVVDYNLFNPGEPYLSDGLLWITETIPGHVRKADVTKVLMQQGSWPSYNIPYFSEMWSLGGYKAELEREHRQGVAADDYSYLYSPRSLMFKRARAEHNVTSFASFLEFLRYNKEGDPLEMGDRCNSISARCDLNPPDATDFDCSGGIDSKAVRWRADLLNDLSFFAISGPSRGVDAPAFAWNKVKNTSVENCKTSLHLGHPDVFDFDWYFMSAGTWGFPANRAVQGDDAVLLRVTRHVGPGRLTSYCLLCVVPFTVSVITWGRRLRTRDVVSGEEDVISGEEDVISEYVAFTG